MRIPAFATRLIASAVLATVASVAAAQQSTAQPQPAGQASQPVRVYTLMPPAAYQALSPEARAAFVAGVMDADMELNRQTHALFEACLQKITAAQRRDIVDQAVAALTPQTLTVMPIVAHNALLGACYKAGYTLAPGT
jgi:hypothetical protein